VADVFISYSRRDGELVRELHDVLTGEGRDVWVDWEDIPPASDWERDIYDSIDAADSLVFVVTASSLASEYCLRELTHAQERGKRIVPFASDGTDPDEAPEGLRQLNWIWCRVGDDRDAAVAKLTSALDTDLEWSRSHTRLLVRAVEWDARRDQSLLLRGRDLKAVEQELAANAGKEPVPTELQQRYVHASRRGAARRQRIVLGSVLLALAISVVLGVAALLQRNSARNATDRATSVALAATAKNRLASDLDQSLLLGLAAYRTNPSPQARDAMISALESARSLEVDQFLHSGTDVASVAVAPDGRTVALGGADGSVSLWDVKARKALGSLPGTAPIVNVGFTRDGSTLLAASSDGALRLWDIAARRPRGEPFEAGRTIASAAVSPDGRLVAAGTDGEDGRVWLWDVATRKLRRLAGPEGSVDHVAFSPDSGTLAAGANDMPGHTVFGSVRLWDTATGKTTGEPQMTGTIAALAFSPVGHLLAPGGHVSEEFGGPGGHGELELWDPLRLRKPVASLSAGPDVTAIAFARDGRTLAVGQGGTTIRLRTTKGLKPSGPPLDGLGGASVAFSRDGHAIVGDAVGGARVWDLRDRGSFGRSIGGGQHQFESAAVSTDGRIVAAGDEGNVVRLADIAAGKVLEPLRLGPSKYAAVYAVAFSADGRTLAAANSNDVVQLWNVHTRKAGDRLPSRGEGFGSTGLAFDPSGTILADGGGHGIRFWSVPERKVVNKTFVGVDTVGFVGAATLATADDHGRIRTWSVTRPTPIAPTRRPADAVDGRFAFSPDGRTVAIGNEAGQVWLWDRTGSKPLIQLPGDVGSRVGGVAFTPDGAMLVVAADGGLSFWDARTGAPLGHPLQRRGFVTAMAVTPDGRRLVSAGDTLRVWDGILWRDLSDLEGQVCKLVIGGLSRAEWAAIADGLPYTRTC
jgi:WD40 repeat protein